MAFWKNTAQQITLNDSANNLTDRERQFLEKSWAIPFSEHYFKQINEGRFSVLYSDNPASRPNTPINVIVGMLIIKEMRGLTDEECVEALLFDISVQRALHTTSCEEQPISDRTLSRFREKCERYYQETGIDLIKEEIKALAAHQAQLQNISPALKRMDSLMIDSSCKKMSRLELLYTIVRNAVEEFIKAKAAGHLDDRLKQYAKEGDKNSVCYRLDKDQVSSKLDEVVKDAVKIREIFEQVFPDTLDESKEYQLLVRMLTEQTKEKDGETVLKPGKDISTDSLQNPSDEDATFRNKAGKNHKGYVGNVVETCDDNGNVITDFDLQPNTYSDEQFATDVIESLGKDSGTEALTTDGAYVSAETIKQAEENGIELVSGKLTGPQTNPIIGEFKIDEDTGEIIECPAGHMPISSKYNETTGVATAHFGLSDCECCPYREQCVAKEQKKSAVVKITGKQIIRAKQAKKMGDEKYKTIINKRNGVEGLPSLLRRMYNVDNMPIRGLVRAKIWFALKIAAINSRRLINAMTMS